MNIFLCLLSILGFSTALPQINFGDTTNTRTESNSDDNFKQIEENEVFAIPKESIFVAEYYDDNEYDYIIDDIVNDANQFCCCIPESDSCTEPSAEQDLISGGDINVRIVNRPPNNCLAGQKECCQDLSVDLSVFGRSTCTPPLPAIQHSPIVPWTQGCQESQVLGSQGCGTRYYEGPAPGLAYGESSPGEFPWTCLLLNQDNDFVGSCVVIPNDSRNDNNIGTRKVLTAAHKLNGFGPNE